MQQNIFFIKGIGISSNSYLISGKKLVLVDSGDGKNFSLLKKEIEAKNFKVEEIDLIINTHCHYDHIGGNSLIVERSNAKVLAMEPDATYIEKGNLFYTCAMNDLSINLKPIKVKRLKEGEEIEKFKILHTPGHTEGSISLYSKNGILISGDLIFGDGGIGRVDLPCGDLKKLISSLEKISKLNIKKIYPGHGKPSVNGNEIIKKALNYAKELLIL